LERIARFFAAQRQKMRPKSLYALALRPNSFALYFSRENAYSAKSV
jgi:hypothetical protein